jgi:hypothetical protein
LNSLGVKFGNTVKISDNCASENKSKHIIGNLRRESERTLIFKSPYHGKSAIDGMHNFPRQVAEKENSQNRALNIPNLIEACYKRELELRNEIYATSSQKKRSGDYKRFFYQLPNTETEWKPFIIPDYQGKFRFSNIPTLINHKNS